MVLQPQSGFYARWPQVAIALGMAMSAVGLATNHLEFIAAGSNVLTVAGLFLVQKRHTR